MTVGESEARRIAAFSNSRIREINRLAVEGGAVNLGQGFPDFPAPAEVKDAARLAVEADANQYTVPAGTAQLREAIAARYDRLYGMTVDPTTDVCVMNGATEAMTSVLLALVEPGDEVVVFEPFYEGYIPQILLAGAVPRIVPLRGDGWAVDEAALRRAISPRTRAVILNNPHNPCGKVFSGDELSDIASVCQKHGVVAISDEVYEHMVYDGMQHIPMATVNGMADLTVTISSLSKTYSVTGWRLGWAIGSATWAADFRKVHDFIAVCSPSPFQAAAVAALALPDTYYQGLLADYAAKRERMVEILNAVGFSAALPQGAYYALADVRKLGQDDDVTAALHLLDVGGVAAVPVSCFYSCGDTDRIQLRFAFCKRDSTLEAAAERLNALFGTPEQGE